MRKPLPADQTIPAQIDEMIRVNHAGEYGAQRIYQGQLAVLKDDATAPVLQHMAEQEQAHLEAFEHLMRNRKGRPTALLPLWHVAGYALGAGTALMGKKAAMACTVAIESVIADHYAEQINALGEGEAELKQTITTFRAEEIEHHNIGLEHEAEGAPAYELLTGAIKLGCRAAIAISKKI